MTVSNRDLCQFLKVVECNDSTYRPKKYPIVLSQAKGSYIWDVEGKKYTDLCAGFGALPLGHNDEHISNVIKEGLSGDQPDISHGLGDVYPSKDKVMLLGALMSKMPTQYAKAALAVTGGQAVEIAVKTSILATGGDSFIAFNDGYHGLDFGALPLTYREDFKKPFKNWFVKDRVHHLPYGCSRQILIDAIDKMHHKGLKPAGLIVEPIQGRGGIVIPPSGWLRMLREVTFQKGILLIFDEIFTGMGRIGSYSEASNVRADLSCFGKAIGGGFPLSACVGTKEVMNEWPVCESEAIHTGTFFGHPLSCKVGFHTLKELDQRSLVERSKVFGAKMLTKIQEQFSDHKLVHEVRGQGMMMAIEFKKDGFGAELMDKLRINGIIAIPSGKHGRCLSITPALNITEEEIDQAMSIIASSIKDLELGL